MPIAKPLVSVITIFFNEERFINEAIESVIAQTCENWELFLVDDGSTDRSVEIASEYARSHSNKIFYLEHQGHKNRGACASRNLGVRHASGKYIAFLDADDVWFPHKLEDQVSIMESYPEAGMVYGSSKYWSSWTGNSNELESDYIPDLGLKPNTLYKPPILLTLLYPLGKGAAPCPSDILLRREVIKFINGFEEDWTGKYQFYEDQAFLSKVYLNSPVYASSQCWIRYRVHSQSCSSRVMESGEYDTVRYFFLNWLENYLPKQEINNKEIRNTLKSALFPYRHPRLNRLLGFLKKTTKNNKQLLKSFSILRMLSPLKQLVLNKNNGPNPPLGKVRFGNLRRLTPISREWGFDRGLPIDRYYIEKFLASHHEDIKGHVLEIGDDSYIRKFGKDRVNRVDILHLFEGFPNATIIGDLAFADHIPPDSFDCIILTQTLQLIYDVRAAINNIYRVLKPGGVLLATFPGISQTYDNEWGKYWCWNFTSLSASRLFEEWFGSSNVCVKSYGNVLTAVSFLHGLAAEELSEQELEFRDEGYQLLLTVRAVKSKRLDNYS